jgi:hypothetical protein
VCLSQVPERFPIRLVERLLAADQLEEVTDVVEELTELVEDEGVQASEDFLALLSHLIQHKSLFLIEISVEGLAVLRLFAVLQEIIEVVHTVPWAIKLKTFIFIFLIWLIKVRINNLLGTFLLYRRCILEA